MYPNLNSRFPNPNNYFFNNTCTMRSAVRPSQRSGRTLCFHSPFSILSSAADRANEFSPTSSLVPIRHVSGCSAYVFSVIQGTSRKVASSAMLPESVMMPWAWLMRKPKCR